MEIKTLCLIDLIDKEGDKYSMVSISNDKYLGDILQSNGKNDVNILERVNRGKGAVSQICQLLSDLCLGSYYFKTANILRNALLLSSLLANSESWYNLTINDVKSLESVDEMLIRKTFNAHSKTPIELLYLESGNVPIRFILMSRRVNFLWYILHEKKNSLLYRFFQAQCQNPVKSDWINTVKSDLTALNIQLNFNQIENTSKTCFKNMVKEKVKIKALSYLRNLQEDHSKSKDLLYHEIKLQDYLKNDNNLTIKQKCFIFAARSRMLDVYCNFKLGKSDLLCRKCKIEDEEQKHLLVCHALQDESIVSNESFPKYEELFGCNVRKIEIIGNILMIRFSRLISNYDKTTCTVNSCAAVASATDLD